eukprot:CAMPEP_0206179498 /NCGR_PEP_ID=MMETSP1474-20131121/67328_1 /ASSEMBLY_ACC=CAM_ASM_001110 /TAXON_ID=97495 /ORGANISM="Imantonia sp., Strain RCC918" /LENGTH=330 /DNA_ID=CAMNT_0053592739 /DNA_START=77 /DNA_END=1067 /DNA_ORIENTATION=-
MAYDDEKNALKYISSNAGVVDLIDCFEENDIGFFVMELAEIDLLDYYIHKNPSESDLQKLLLSLAFAVKSLHMNGVAHLDLKPENCLVFGNENIKLCDFGNSMFFEEDMRYYGKRGSPGYVAPEMEEGIPFNPKAADIGDLVFYEFQVHEYVITSDILGSGGHGDVFIGKNLDTNQNVAIKCFMLDSERNKMAYDNEKKALEFMSSNSGIIDLVDCFEHNGIGLIVMELAEYDLLDYYIEKNPSESDLKKLLLSLAHSIKVLHMNGIAHLDLKPENCLVFGNENIKLCDFGNALFFRENIRYYGRRGSPGYVAPEMEEGIPFNPKAADIW